MRGFASNEPLSVVSDPVNLLYHGVTEVSRSVVLSKLAGGPVFAVHLGLQRFNANRWRDGLIDTPAAFVFPRGGRAESGSGEVGRVVSSILLEVLPGPCFHPWAEP